MIKHLKAYIDLTRAHFVLAWPILFCAGLMLAFANYGGFSWSLTIRAALIGLFGFEAGFILNDYVDREYDKKDIEHHRLTSYFRPFKKRPIAAGLISPSSALALLIAFIIIATLLIMTLPFPNSLFVFVLMIYSYGVEYFYQVKKRKQNFPWAQIIGRTDLGLFPVAGYLCYGFPDKTALMIFLLFFPWALAHLAVNDLIDIKNDVARGLKTITTLYGIKWTKAWISVFTILHLIVVILFAMGYGSTLSVGFVLAFFLLLTANCIIFQETGHEPELVALFIFHATMFIYALSMILHYALGGIY